MLERINKLLRRLEWLPGLVCLEPGSPEPGCPFCRAARRKGQHYAECELKACLDVLEMVIAKAEETKS